MKVKGAVEKIFSKAAGKFKNLSYSIKVDGYEQWFGHGWKEPLCEEGQTVQFEASQNKNGFWSVDGDIVVVQSAPQTASGATGVPKMAKAETDLQYNYRFSLAHARDLAALLLQHGILPTSGRAKTKSPSFEEVSTFILETADITFRDVMDVADLAERLEVVEPEAEDVTPGPDED